jgi:hypothetical protein
VIDYRYLYSLILECCAREEERGKALDGKITTLIAGVTALIGFAIRSPSSPLSTSAALLAVVPLVSLFGALMVRRGRVAPTPESLETFFPEYPVRTLRDSVTAMTRICRTNAELNEMKAARLDIAAILAAFATAAFLFVQAVAAFH